MSIRKKNPSLPLPNMSTVYAHKGGICAKKVKGLVVIKSLPKNERRILFALINEGGKN